MSPSRGHLSAGWTPMWSRARRPITPCSPARGLSVEPLQDHSLSPCIMVVTSALKVGELQVLRVDPSYVVFHKD